MTREATLRGRMGAGQPDLVADLYLYPPDAGGTTKPVSLGWGCPCTREQDLHQGWDGYPLLDREMLPGEQRRVGFVFLSGRVAVDALAPNGRFYLWEGRFIGEAVVIQEPEKGS